MSDAAKPELDANMKRLAGKLIPSEARERMAKLSPEERKKVIDATAQIIAKHLVKLGKMRREH